MEKTFKEMVEEIPRTNSTLDDLINKATSSAPDRSVTLTIDLQNTPAAQVEKVAEFLYWWIGKAPVFAKGHPLVPTGTAPTFIEIPVKVVERCYSRLQKDFDSLLGKPLRSPDEVESEKQAQKLRKALEDAIPHPDDLWPNIYISRTMVMELMSMFNNRWDVKTQKDEDDYLALYSAYHEIPESELEWGTTPMGTRGISRKPKEG